MKFACEYYNMFFNIDGYDELIVHLSPTHDLTKIEDFFKQHPKQTIIIWIEDMMHFNQQKWLGKLLTYIPIDKYNWKLKVRDPWSKDTQEVVEECRNTGVRFMYDMLIDSWEILQSLVKKKPSDLYITNSLAFDMVNVSEFLHNNNIQVRVYPNIAQSAAPDDNDITSFFIRPEDTRLYVDYIDVLEIFVPIGADKLKSFYYIVYSNSLKWKGYLGDFIIGLDSQDCFNNSMMNGFGGARTKCKRDCKKNSSCDLCNLIVSFGKMLTKRNLALNYDNEKPFKVDKTGKFLTQKIKNDLADSILKNLDYDFLTPEDKQHIIENFKNL